MYYLTLITHLLALLQLSSISRAEPDGFRWEFGGEIVSGQLTTCQRVPITLSPTPSNGDFPLRITPPFVIHAYAIDGTPVTSVIGDEPSKLEYLVQHPVGSILIFDVVDSQGLRGGSSRRLYNVIAGSSTSCLTARDVDSSSFTVSSNSTTSLSTCEGYEIKAAGGTPPYSLTLLTLDSVHNTSLGDGGDTYQHTNRAQSDNILIAAISDSTGKWATGTPKILTQGSNDIACQNPTSLDGSPLMSSGAGSNQLQPANIMPKTDNEQPQNDRHRVPLLVVLLTSLSVVFFVIPAATFTAWYLVARKRRERALSEKPDFILPYERPDQSCRGEILRRSAFVMPCVPGSKSRPNSYPTSMTVPLVPVRSCSTRALPRPPSLDDSDASSQYPPLPNSESYSDFETESLATATPRRDPHLHRSPSAYTFATTTTRLTRTDAWSTMSVHGHSHATEHHDIPELPPPPYFPARAEIRG